MNPRRTLARWPGFLQSLQPRHRDKHIGLTDEGGIALAAIRGLNQKLTEKDAEIQALKAKAAQVDAMESRLKELEAAVSQFESRK